jgi:hypothetical protein
MTLTKILCAAQLADGFAGEAARVTAVVTLARDTLVKKVR